MWPDHPARSAQQSGADLESSFDDRSTPAMTSQPPKDFLALSHGHEWVNFYESFDKLVQDHLSRSSELLRRAMSLPEVADREVAQMRDGLEARLNSERERNHATLSVLKQEIGKSHQQASTLAMMMSSMMTDLDRLSKNVEAAIAQASAGEAPTAVTAASADAVSEESNNSSFASAISDAGHAGTAQLVEPETAPVSAPAQEWVETIAGDDAPVAEAEADLSWEELSNDVPSPEAIQAETSAEEQAEIDLNALAAMEAETVEHSAADETNGATSEQTPEERSRPHWLSMARASNNS
jgi:hypothetical protein